MSKIEILNVTKKIGKNIVLENISLTFESGKVIGLKGINGSGKTMLMRLISGLISPSSGEVTINGKRLGKDISFPESIGILIENPSFIDYYSGYKNLEILASINGLISKDEIKKIIKLVGLDPNDNKKYKKYSLGMKQRLGIAAAIMEKPDIIVLDEPTNSLDSDGVSLVEKIVKEAKNRDALILLACHDYEILKVLCDEIYFIEDGKITNHITEVII